MNHKLSIGEHTAADIAEMPFSGALAVLRQAEQPSDDTKGRKAVRGGLVRLRAGRIAMLPNVFQYRTDEGAEYEREQQVKRLTGALLAKPADQRELEPIIVKSVGGTWVCIDGHHRLLAYGATGVKVIPARPFRGSIGDALLEAGMANSKTKLAMTQRDRSEAAWRLSVANQHSKREVCEAVGASDGLVSEMRRVRKKLLAMGKEPGEHIWIHARMLARGDEPGEGGEDQREKLVKRFEDTLSRTFGTSVHKNRELLSEALENLYPSLVEAIVERNMSEYLEGIDGDDDLGF